MLDVVEVECPFCFEKLEVGLDPQSLGEMVQDCEVCCNPWLLRVSRDHDGDLVVQVEPAN